MAQSGDGSRLKNIVLSTFMGHLKTLRSCFKIIQVSKGQGENRRKSAVYMGVNEHFESIFNTVMNPPKDFKQLFR